MAARRPLDHPTDRRRPHPGVAVTTSDGVSWSWDELVHEFAPALAAYARSRGIREPDDVVQDVLVTAVRKLDGFDGDTANLRSWLFTLAHRRIADRHRRFYRSPLLLVADHEPTPSHDAEVDHGLLQSEAVVDAMAAFEVLDERQRDVLRRRIIDERSPREVAEELGLSPGNVRVIQCRALARVRRHLEDGGRRAAGIAVVATGLRGLGTTLPTGGAVGDWIDRVRAASRASGAVGATATTTAVGTSGATGGAGGAGIASTVAGATGGTGVVATLGATGLAVALVAGGGAAAITDPAPPPAGVVAAGSAATTTGPARSGGSAPADPLRVTAGPTWPARPTDGPSAPWHTGVPGPTVVTRGDASPAARGDAGTTTQPISREGLVAMASGAPGPGMAAPAAVEAGLRDPVRSVGDGLDLTTAGQLLLDPLADTRQVVETLRRTMALLAAAGTALDTTADGLSETLDTTGSIADTARSAVEDLPLEDLAPGPAGGDAATPSSDGEAPGDADQGSHEDTTIPAVGTATDRRGASTPGGASDAVEDPGGEVAPVAGDVAGDLAETGDELGAEVGEVVDDVEDAVDDIVADTVDDVVDGTVVDDLGDGIGVGALGDD